MRRLAVFTFFVLLFSSRLFAQAGNASLTGFVQDPAKAFVPGVKVIAINTDTNQRFEVTTNKDGSYYISPLPVGPYRMQIEKAGFRTIRKEGLFLHTQDVLQLNYDLAVGSAVETITVTGERSNINTTDAAVGTVIDHQFVENIPMNGRSFQTLILLSPGVVTNNPNGSDPGEYSVNGQRTDSNTYSVDGASTMNSAGMTSGSGSAGMLPSETALGTTQSMLSIDAMQEFRITTSTYSAEYGRQPGAQISFRSKSGTNEYHGTLYDYLRNSVFDANNWFNTYATTPIPTPAERQNDFGGTIGGPLSIPYLYSGKNRAFFFFSYEGLRVTSPYPAMIFQVPSNGTYNTATYADPRWANLRQYAPTALQAFVNAWPLPNCSTAQDPQCVDYGDGLSPYLSSQPYTGALDSIGARVDYQLFSSMRLFARYSDTTSNTVNGYTSGPDTFQFPTRNRVYLLGADNTFGSSVSNELRLQYSPSLYNPIYNPRREGGASNSFDLYAAQGIPAGGETFVRFNLDATSTMYAVNYGSVQFQPNATDAITWAHGKHLFKAGVDYRQTTAYYGDGRLSRGPTVEYYYYNPSEVLGNAPTSLVQSYTREDPTFKNLGLFVQDEWRFRPRLSLSLGLRWDVAPPPSISGPPMYTYTGSVNKPSSLGLSSPGAPLYKTTYTGFAPRLGVAVVIHDDPGHKLVLRAGGGLFNETIALSQLFGEGTNLGGGVELESTNLAFPLTPSQIYLPIVSKLPPLSSATPVNVEYYPDNRIVPPYTLQWNASLEQELGSNQSVTLGYVAALGRKLITQKEYAMAKFNPDFGTFYLYENGPGSSYNALQLKYQRQMSHGLQVLASYTWSHSLDWRSTQQTAAFPLQKGNSDHDVRNNFSVALVYKVPTLSSNRLVKAITSQWSADVLLVARSAFPYTPVGPAIVDPVTGNDIFGELNYSGQNPYVYKRGIPGGRQLNPALFSVTTAALAVGTAPRNFLRGFGENQANVALQRDIPLQAKVKLLFRAEAFNLVNHPNFGTINSGCGITTLGATCTNPLMGQASNTLSAGLGTLSSLYQQGGPRSLQFMLKLQF